MTQANLDAALEMANKWREVSGQEILSAWLPSLPQEGKYCLLARAFNKDCFVMYETVPDELGIGSVGTDPDTGDPAQMLSNSGRVMFNTDEDAELFSKTFRLAPPRFKVVDLPDEIALVAWEFDNGAYREFVEND